MDMNSWRFTLSLGCAFITLNEVITTATVRPNSTTSSALTWRTVNSCSFRADEKCMAGYSAQRWLLQLNGAVGFEVQPRISHKDRIMYSDGPAAAAQCTKGSFAAIMESSTIRVAKGQTRLLRVSFSYSFWKPLNLTRSRLYVRVAQWNETVNKWSMVKKLRSIQFEDEMWKRSTAVVTITDDSRIRFAYRLADCGGTMGLRDLEVEEACMGNSCGATELPTSPTFGPPVTAVTTGAPRTISTTPSTTVTTVPTSATSFPPYRTAATSRFSAIVNLTTSPTAVVSWVTVPGSAVTADTVTTASTSGDNTGTSATGSADPTVETRDDNESTVIAVSAALSIAVVIIAAIISFTVYRHKRKSSTPKYASILDPQYGLKKPDVPPRTPLPDRTQPFVRQRRRPSANQLPVYHLSGPKSFQFKQLHDLEHIGSGVSSEVYSANYCEQDDYVIKVAVKVLQDVHASGIGAAKEVEREAELAATLNHASIVKFYGVCVNRDVVALIYEFMDVGNLLDLLRGACIYAGERKVRRGSSFTGDKSTINPNRQCLTDTELFGFSRDVARGLSYLAENRIVHRDLAARNCFVSSPTYRVKIGDFGMSRHLRDASDYRPETHHLRLPIRWLPPESLKNEYRHSVESDVWSFGVVLWEIFSGGQVPWGAETKVEKVRAAIIGGAKLEVLSSFPSAIVRLIESCMAYRSEERPSARSIVVSLTRRDSADGMRLGDVTNYLECGEREGVDVMTEETTLG